MKKQPMGVLGILSLCIVLGAGFVQAQSLSKMKVDVPFDFIVGKTICSAGEYVLDRQHGMPVWRIESEDGRASVRVFTAAKQTDSVQEKGRLTFNKYGDTYFLSEITTPGTNRAAVLAKPTLELELAVNRTGVQTSIPVEP